MIRRRTLWRVETVCISGPALLDHRDATPHAGEHGFLLHFAANKKDCQCPRKGEILRLKVLERDMALRAGSYQTQEAKNEQFKKIFRELKNYYGF